MSEHHPPASLKQRLLSSGQLVVALAITLGVLGWLLFAPTPAEPEHGPKRTTLNDSVRVVGTRLISIKADTPLRAKLSAVTATKTSLTEPLFTVSGRVVASLRPSVGKAGEDWHFDSPEITTIYYDWRKAQNDILFARTQLAAVQELATTRLDASKKVVERLKKLVEAGTDSQKDLAAEQANLLQIQIQGKKDVHEAQSALTIAERNELALTKQLQQAGLDPDLLRATKSDSDLVMAEVPEARLTQVQIGQGCEAKFFGVPSQLFNGKVDRVLPALSKERRSLRVLFIVHDPKDQVRPGMFAEIGLGTDARQAIMIPTEALLHIGRSDYVLVKDQGDQWRAVEVKVGELHGDRVEIAGGLAEGQEVLTTGAILLKPPVVLALAK